MLSNRKTAGAAGALVLALSTLTPAVSLAGDDVIAMGQEIAMDRARGNCIACHILPDGQSPGAIGPALVAMQARYPDKEKLREQIWDASIANPGTSMPPFGKHGILSEDEFNAVLEYIWSILSGRRSQTHHRR